jgi:hypothetical protein
MTFAKKGWQCSTLFLFNTLLKRSIKGIVLRKFGVLFLVSFESLEVSTPFFMLSVFLKYRRFHVEFSNIRRSAGSFIKSQNS